MRKLWCTGAIAGGILLLGAAPAWAGDAPTGKDKDALPAADVLRTVPAPDRPVAVKGAPVPVDGISGLCPDGRAAGGTTVLVRRVSGLPLGGSPVQPGRAGAGMPDDGDDPVTAPDFPPRSTPDPSVLVGPNTLVDPDAVIDPADTDDLDFAVDPDAVLDSDTPVDPDAVIDPDDPADAIVPASAPAAVPTAGAAAVSAPPAADTADASTPAAATPPTPAKPGTTGTSGAPAFAAEQKPKTPALPAVDDPRLLEEPVDGFVNREKWKR